MMVAVGAAARASPSEPTARNFPFWIATALAAGFCLSSVVTLALTMIRALSGIGISFTGLVGEACCGKRIPRLAEAETLR